MDGEDEVWMFIEVEYELVSEDSWGALDWESQRSNDSHTLDKSYSNEDGRHWRGQYLHSHWAEDSVL